MPQSFDIEIKTLTPLWTGGIDGTCDHLHISGLMGSLRYWYEAIVRGVGGYACDPTNGGCIYKPDDSKDPEHTGLKSICAACYLFGTTGWARLFRMSTNAQLKSEYEVKKVNMSIGIDTRTMVQRKRDIPLGFLGLNTDLHFTAQFRHISTKMHLENYLAKEQVMAVLWFIHTFAGLGPKQQRGRGAVEISLQNETQWKNKDFKKVLQKLQSDRKQFKPAPEPSELPQNFNEWPDLRQFFSFTAQYHTKPKERPAPTDRQKKYGITTETPMKISALRHWMEINHKGPADLDSLFGTINGQTRASRVYFDFHQVGAEYFLHIYGFGITEDRNWDREKLLPLLKKYINEVWAVASIVENWDGTLLSLEVNS